MGIWHKYFSLDELNLRSQDTLAAYFGISFTEIGEETLTAIMPVTQKIKQPLGLVHGGANVVLAETLASTAANCVIDIKNYYCVGLEINANHLRSVREGKIIGKTWPIHLGKSTQVWQIDLFDEAGKQTCVSRMTAAVIVRK